MATDLEIDPSETPEVPSSPLSPDTTEPDEATESVEELKEKLAAAEAETKTWKGRVEKATEKKPKTATPADLEELEWKLENKDRITLVKDEFEKILAEGFHGEPVSKKIALELAEKQAKVDSSATRRSRSDDMTTPSVTMRNVNPKGYEDDLDRRLGLTLEKKRALEEKHPHLKM